MEKRERFYNIDFLRFLGAITIVVFHIFLCGMNDFKDSIPIVSMCQQKMSYAWVWVDFFFIISGYFLFSTTNFKMKFIDFAQKRIIRLLPLLLFAIILYNILSHFGLLYYKKYINIYSALFLVSTGLTKNIVENINPTWFISVLFWASMFYFYLKKAVKTEIFNLITAILVLFSYVYTLHTSISPRVVTDNFLNGGLLRAIGGIGLGYFLYLLKKENKITCKNLIQKLIITFTEGYLLCFVIYNTTFHRINFNNYTIFVLAFIPLILLFLYNQGFITNFLNNKFSAFLGKYSYAIFVMHIIPINIAYSNFWKINTAMLSENFALNVIGVFLVGIILGVISHHLVEKPATKYLTEKWLNNKLSKNINVDKISVTVDE